MNEFERVLRRAVVEDPDADHDSEIGDPIEPVSAISGLPFKVLERVQQFEHYDSKHPIARTAIARPGLELTFDQAAFQAVLDDLDHD